MSQPRTLIINADDLGLSPEVDAGILDCVKAGTVTAVSVMVNPPYEADIAPFVAAGVSICLHWNLVPLPAQFDPGDAERELRAQLDRFRQITGREPAQLNFHKHLHARDGRLLEIALKLARETGASLRAINPAMREHCRACGVRTTDHFVGDVVPAPYWTEVRLREVLATLPPGETELMCHPGKNVGPIGGLFYLAERDTERVTFTSPATAALIGGLQLRGFLR
ncbi:MAG: ChbG/HpnK family deacetylase [Verrucomicrobia bacterium]|nr:ChbG/HpnK family deacetylase [Verrucomicrobiota bacterium]